MNAICFSLSLSLSFCTLCCVERFLWHQCCCCCYFYRCYYGGRCLTSSAPCSFFPFFRPVHKHTHTESAVRVKELFQPRHCHYHRSRFIVDNVTPIACESFSTLNLLSFIGPNGQRGKKSPPEKEADTNTNAFAGTYEWSKR